MFRQFTRKKSIEMILCDARDGVDTDSGATHNDTTMARVLGTTDLTALGVAAIIGAGIFSTIGNAAFNGGPAVVFLFIFTAIACGFSALCYAEFASRIPVAGSAYTYAYASFGELAAWIIGWDLIMEYAIGNIAVAISWSDYFTSLLAGYGIRFPDWLSMDYLTASRGSEQIVNLLISGKSLSSIQNMPEMANALLSWHAMQNAPLLFGVRLVCDLPAFGITALITALVFIGIKESRNASNIMVALKVAVVLLVIIMGAFYVNPQNWTPFAPNGISGVLKGVSGVFFAYIGFDAISTTAEECKNPQRDLPRGMLFSLIICTVLYILVALILTGMVNYNLLQVGDPLAFVFGPAGANVPWISGVIAVSAVIAMATVLLVFQIGQPRIWMAMSRDGLLPPIFSSLHKKYRTPWFSTLVTGVIVSVPSLFMNLTEVTDLTSIGTLFAFILVSGGVLMLKDDGMARGRFKIPYFSGRYSVPILVIAILYILHITSPQSLANALSAGGGWDEIKHKIPFFIYLVCAVFLIVITILKRLSFIPVMGLLTCGYLMTELGWTNWLRFGIWLAVGLLLYFLYGRKNSKISSARE